MKISDLSSMIEDFTSIFPYPVSEEESNEIAKTLIFIANMHREGCSIKQIYEILKSNKDVQFFDLGNLGKNICALYVGKKHFNYVIENTAVNVIKEDSQNFIMSINILNKNTYEAVLTANLNFLEE